MPDIFLSYSRDDQGTARRFAQGFEREGFSVWWDQTLRSGENYDQVTEAALREAKAVVVLWSKHSVDSRWVRAEATQADRNGTLVPVMIEPCNRPIMFELKHTAELAHWKGDAGDKAWVAFVSDVRQFVDKNSSGPTPPPGSPPVGHLSRKTVLAAIAVGVVLLLAAGGGMWMAGRMSGKTPADKVAANTASDASVAVLPFRDMSSAKDQEYFADGISEEILNSLAGIPDLQVAGRTSSFSFKGKDADLRTIGETLNVKNILEGSIRKDGGKLRITAQLINAVTGYHLWSKTYERPMDDVFRIQEDIAAAVAQALAVTLGVTGIHAQGMTHNVEAFDAFLAGNAQATQLTPDSLRRGIELWQRAIALDPSFALAWANLDDVYRTLAPGLLPEESPQAWREKADAALEEVRRLVPDAYYVHELLAERSVSSNAWSEAAREYQVGAAAMKLQDPKRLAALGASRAPPGFLWRVGRFKEALPLIEGARASDPLNVTVAIALAELNAETGNFPASFKEWDRGLTLEGGQLFVRGGGLLTALAIRDRALTDKWLDAFIGLGSGNVGGDVNAAMKPLLEKPVEALAELHRRAKAAPTYFDLLPIAGWMAYFGDADGALEILRSDTVRAGPPDALPTNFWRPVMRDVRKLPGFKQLVRDIGLVDYWKEFGWPDLCKPVGKDDFECT